MTAYAQQDPMFTHYMDNTLSINPAFAGSSDALSMTLLNRNQWVGFDGAPVSQTFTVHSPIRSERIGLGASVIQDKIGPAKSTSVYADFAFRINLTKKSKLSFGLKGGVSFYSADLTTVVLNQQKDAAFANKIDNRVMPNFGFGLYYNRERFYAGLSTPKLFENNYSEGTTSAGISIAKEKGHLYFVTGSTVFVSKAVDFKPSALIKVTSGAPISADLSALFEVNKKVQAGAMFRPGESAGLLIGLNITEQLVFGYSFDFSVTNNMAKYNQGSHEIMIKYNLVYSNEKKIKSSRYF